MFHANTRHERGIEPVQNLSRALCAVAAIIDYRLRRRAAGGLPPRAASEKRVVSVEPFGLMFAVSLDIPSGKVCFSDGITVLVRGFWQPGLDEGTFRVDDDVLKFRIASVGTKIRLVGDDHETTAVVRSPRVAELAEIKPGRGLGTRSRNLCTPLSGVLLRLFASEGDHLKRGDTIAIVEAMKMENRLTAEADMTIKRVVVSEGAILEARQPILMFE